MNQDFQGQAVFNISQPSMDHIAVNIPSKILKQINIYLTFRRFSSGFLITYNRANVSGAEKDD